MIADQEARSRQLFGEALLLPPGRRSEYLAERCAGDAALRADVESLLSFHDAEGPFMDRPAVEEFAPDGAAAAHADLTPFRTGERVGRYTILEPLGEGGMGIVYAARQDAPERRVALKVLRPGLLRLSMRRRFRQEAEALARLQHPGIAQVIEAGLAGEGESARPYLVMELVRGLPLVRHAAEHALTLPQRLTLLAEVCDAVHHAHQRGVVHRDLKPANILVDEAGRPKILDFGIARVAGDIPGVTMEHTHALHLVGTLPYMSPEQLGADPAAVTAASDVYALGVILYELVGGRTPLDVSGLTLPAAAGVITNQKPPPLSSHDRRCRGDLDVIAATALAKEPQRRYASAAALGADIRRFLAHEPITARPPTTLYQLARLARRHRAASGAVAGLGAALIVGTVLVSLALVRAVSAEHAAGVHLAEARAAVGRAQTFGAFLRRTLAFAGPGFARGRDATLLREMLDEAAAASHAIAPDQPEARAEVQQTIGETYASIGEYDKAEAILTAALVTRLERFGERHPDTLQTLGTLALLSLERSDYSEAVVRFRKVLALRTEALGPEHPDTLDTAAGLARVLLEWPNQETYEEGLALCAATLEAQRRVLGPRDQNLIVSLITVGMAQRRAGRLVEAEAALREALDIRSDLFGDDSPEVASLLVNLGSVRRYAGDLAEAERLLTKGLEIRRRELGEGHFALAWPMLELAEIRLEQGRVDEADALVRSTIAIAETRLGPTHAQVGEAVEVLARVDFSAGRRDDSIAHFVRAAELFAASYGDDHWRVREALARAEAAAAGEWPSRVSRTAPFRQR